MGIHTIYHIKTQKLQNNSSIEFKNKLKLQNRIEIEPLIKEPTTLTFVTTEKCSSACSSCCFQCSPKRSKRLTKEQMVGYRNTKFPYGNWRTADPGHIHYKWRLNDEDS